MHARGKHYYKNRSKRNRRKLSMLYDAMWRRDNMDFDGEVVEDLCDISKGYKGLVLHINDHGNVTLYKAFRNGNVHEIASMV